MYNTENSTSQINTSGFFTKPCMRFINRELSWLEFNFRVLEEVENKSNPLFERLKFLAISASNLDEFFMIRVAGIKEQIKHETTGLSPDGLTATEQLQKIAERTKHLIEKQQKCWLAIKSSLAKKAITIVDKEEIAGKDKSWLKKYFLNEIFPAISPIVVDQVHPFPFLPNLTLAIVAQLEMSESPKVLKAGLQRVVDNQKYVVTILPHKIPRFIQIRGKGKRYIALEDLIILFGKILFPDSVIKGFAVIQVTRDSDIEIEDDAADLVSSFESAVKKRKRGSIIAMKIKDYGNHDLHQFLGEGLGVGEHDIFKVDALLGLDALMELYRLDFPKLKYDSYAERFPERINDFGGDCFAAIAAKDIIVHHPYETFDVVVKFLKQAALDKDVVAIKQTLYRTGNDSPIVKALVEAAEAGKAVTVVVELKARFDEELNIKWARDLERAGAQVVFGFANLKTHAKVSLVVRREQDKLKTYVHLGTGNYHPYTARNYSDLSFFTCDHNLCVDTSYLFNYLTGYSAVHEYKSLVVAPATLKLTILNLINAEIVHAKAGRPANIWAKMNALVDEEVIDALYKASMQGVEIDLVVRGICMLRPGIPGFSENIRVKSIVGRFLEHARIVCFGAGHTLPSDKAKVFISSADWMPRNFNGRVEVMVPITNPTVHEQVMEQIMVANIKDQKQTWQLNEDGKYVRVAHTDASFCAHEYFMTNPSLSGRGKALTQAESKKQKRKIYQLLKKRRKRI